jgi:hypothetical protein
VSHSPATSVQCKWKLDESVGFFTEDKIGINTVRMDLDLMGHSPLPKTIGEVLAAEIPRGPVGIAGSERVANDGEDLVECIENSFVAREAHERVLSGRRHHSLGDAEVGALQHFAGVTEQSANGPAWAVLHRSIESGRSGSNREPFAFPL